LRFPLMFLIVPLVLLLLWRYVTGTGRVGPYADVDELLRFQGGQTVLKTALGLVFLVLLSVPLGEMGVFHSLVVGVGNLDHFHALTLLLLIAAGATGVTVARDQWLPAPADARRRTAVHNALAGATAFVMVWGCVALYTPSVQMFHWAFGARIQRALANEGPLVAYLIALVDSMLLGVLAGAFLGLLRPAILRLEEALSGGSRR